MDNNFVASNKNYAADFYDEKDIKLKNSRDIFCTKQAGVYSPTDFTNKITVEYIIALLLTKCFYIDSLDEVIPTPNVPIYIEKSYFIRPRHLDETEESVFSNNGICTNWDFNVGCKLKRQDKPFECRLKLKEMGESSLHKNKGMGKFEIIKLWKPYQLIIREAIRKYGNIKNSLTVESFTIDNNVSRSIENIMEKVIQFYSDKEII